MDTPEAGYNQCSIGTVFFRVSSRQILACPGMNGLLAGPLNDAAGLDAVPADLASVVQQVLPPPPRFAADQPHPQSARSRALRGQDGVVPGLTRTC